MRTALYVYEPSTVTIRAKDPGESCVMLLRYNRKGEEVSLGSRKLDPGIYMIVSKSALEISSSQVSVVPLSGEKDIPPEPRAQVVGLEHGATAASIQQFFAVTKGIEVGDPPPQPVSPAGSGTSKITDDPDGI
jgi:hypothetical protein